MVLQAACLLLPEVQATSEQITNVNQSLNTGTHIQRNGTRANSASANVEGSILLYNGMRVVATKKRLEELEKQNQEYLNATIENTIATVMTQYYDVVRQQSYLQTLDTSIACSTKTTGYCKNTIECWACKQCRFISIAT